MRKQLSEVTLPLWLGHLERWLEQAGGTYFVGNGITIADLVIYTRMKWLRRGVRFGFDYYSFEVNLAYPMLFVFMYVPLGNSSML